MDALADYTGDQNMHIGLVTETYSPEVNGVAMTLSRLVNGLQLRGHDVDIYRPAQSKSDKANAEENHTLLPGMPVPGYSEMHFGLPATRFFKKHWLAKRPDVLYVATEGPLGASAINVARKLGIPVISGFHTNFHSYSNHYRIGWLAPVIFSYLRRLHNKTALTLVPTRALAEHLGNHGFNNVTVMQRGVDTGLFSPTRRDPQLRAQWQADENTKVYLYVGRIAAEKNIHQAVETVNAVSGHSNARFVLVGDGPLREKLQQKYPGFIFCGTQLGESLAAHYASADVLLFPSKTETFGNVVTEGMASGLAVIAYDEAAAHEHISDMHNGVLAKDSGCRSFTSVALQLCKQPEKISSIGNEAARYCQNLGWPIIVQQFESLLYSVGEQSASFSESSYSPGVLP